MPEQLRIALEIQSGVRNPDEKGSQNIAFHINQRDEGIDLNGVSGALMATRNMQMQTFITQPDTEDDTPIAFAANQRDEVRDLHDVAGALGTQLGMKQQTFIMAEQAPDVLCLNDQGGQFMACTENITGTLRAQMHHHQPLILESNQEHAVISWHKRMLYPGGSFKNPNLTAAGMSLITVAANSLPLSIASAGASGRS